MQKEIQLGYEYLNRTVTSIGIQAEIGLDRKFETTVKANDLHRFVLARDGVDIGFDACAEDFSAMVALRLFGCTRRMIADHCMAVIHGQIDNPRQRFFHSENGFAADTDCTAVTIIALAEMGLLSDESLIARGSGLLRAAAPADDKSLWPTAVMVYWEDDVEQLRGRKQDPAVAANVLCALHLAQNAGMADPEDIMGATKDYVMSHIVSGAYINGTRYYPSPETFLYFASNTCRCKQDEKTLTGALVKCTPKDPLAASHWLLAACHVGLVNEQTDAMYNALLCAQNEDGSWQAAPFYSLGKRAMYFGSRSVTTMFAVKAIETYTSQAHG